MAHKNAKPVYKVIQTSLHDFFRGVNLAASQEEAAKKSPSELIFDKHYGVIFDDSEFGQKSLESVCMLLDANKIKYNILSFKGKDFIFDFTNPTQQDA